MKKEITQELKQSNVLKIVKKLTGETIKINSKRVDGKEYVWFETESRNSDMIENLSFWKHTFNYFVKQIMDTYLTNYFDQYFQSRETAFKRPNRVGYYSHSEMHYKFKLDTLIDLTDFSISVTVYKTINSGSYTYDLNNRETYTIIKTTNDNQEFPEEYLVKNVTPDNFKKIIDHMKYDIVLMY